MVTRIVQIAVSLAQEEATAIQVVDAEMRVAVRDFHAISFLTDHQKVETAILQILADHETQTTPRHVQWAYRYYFTFIVVRNQAQTKFAVEAGIPLVDTKVDSAFGKHHK